PASSLRVTASAAVTPLDRRRGGLMRRPPPTGTARRTSAPGPHRGRVPGRRHRPRPPPRTRRRRGLLRDGEDPGTGGGPARPRCTPRTGRPPHPRIRAARRAGAEPEGPAPQNGRRAAPPGRGGGPGTPGRPPRRAPPRRALLSRL